MASVVSADDLAVIRSWCGSSVGDPDSDVFGQPDLVARMDRLGSAEAVALEVLRQRRADVLADPVSFSLAGDVAEDSAVNVAGLDAAIRQLEGIVGDRGGRGAVSVGRMVRAGGRRR